MVEIQRLWGSRFKLDSLCDFIYDPFRNFLPEDLMEQKCDSCGDFETQLFEVHRLYVTPETWDTEYSVTRIEESEFWCAACCSMYPNELA